ncbi:hypothetical protein D3C76_986150 [compost metagenome]
MGQAKCLQRQHFAARMTLGRGGMQGNRSGLLDLAGGVMHFAQQCLPGVAMVAVLLARRGLAALLLAVDQDLGLVGMPGLTPGPGLMAFQVFALALQFTGLALLLLLQSGKLLLGLRHLAGFLCCIEAVVAAIGLQPQAGQFDNARHVRQQAAVVTDYQQTSAPGLDHAQQLGTGVAVQVIARFVEYQVVGTAEPCACQRHAHGLAAAQAACGLAPVKVTQAVALQVHLQLLADIPALANGVEILGVDAALLDALQRRNHRPHLGQVGKRGAALDYLLVQQMDRPPAPALAAARCTLAGKNLP